MAFQTAPPLHADSPGARSRNTNTWFHVVHRGEEETLKQLYYSTRLQSISLPLTESQHLVPFHELCTPASQCADHGFFSRYVWL
ncbi:hypothetical protein GDO81_006181 [Engystomops pustulosus]|uniref:Uncharacterized protein n=1 Tax=Engystomops pustulosus TaxID=76066 RepID=A0AAV7CV08_ENGPU|nr:hypothetical protein GDO81_006181 [Engystomops pustulosus]KAG8588964.1 hypothetical protein GDO81_006181 [Engystomops pustulosus]